MLSLTGGDGGIMRNQPHLDCDLPRRSVSIRANKEQPTRVRQPFLIDSTQYPHRVVHMLKNSAIATLEASTQVMLGKNSRSLLVKSPLKLPNSNALPIRNRGLNDSIM